jgi:hypothetical protein
MIRRLAVVLSVWQVFACSHDELGPDGQIFDDSCESIPLPAWEQIFSGNETCPFPDNQCPEPAPFVPTELTAPAFERVPLGSLVTDGWLAQQLIVQANGVSGWYQALHYPLVNQSTWVGGPKDIQPLQWVTYWLNGNVPLMGLLNAGGTEQTKHLVHDLGGIVDRYVAYILDHQKPTGQLGPKACGWQFPTMNAIRSLIMYSESSDPATKQRVGKAILASLMELRNCSINGKTSGGTRWPSHAEGVIEYLDAFPPKDPSDFAKIMNVRRMILALLTY